MTVISTEPEGRVVVISTEPEGRVEKSVNNDR